MNLWYGTFQALFDINLDRRGVGTEDSKPSDFYEWRGILYFNANGGLDLG